MNTQVSNTSTKWVGWVVIALTVVMVAQYALTEYHRYELAQDRQRVVRCLTDWAGSFQRIIEARAAAATEAEKPPYPPPPSVCVESGVTP